MKEKELVINKDSTTKDIIAENKNRYSSYFRTDYNPYIGDYRCEVIERIEIHLWGAKMYLPLSMKDNRVVRAIRANKINELNKYYLPEKEYREDIITGISNDRLAHDFEYWAALCGKIQHKETKQMIPFILNRGQRRLIGRYEKQRLSGKPIRVILVKARQWGGSTATQIYMLWLQIYHYENWHSAIISQLQSQSVNIRNMTNKVINNLPEYHKKISLKTFQGQQLIRIIPERGNIILVASAETPDAVRSFDFSMVHLSEVALWPDTPTKSGDDLAQSIYATVPDVAGTFIVLESTAKGIGNFFHKQWLAAIDNMKNKLDGLYPVFVAWFDIDLYKRPIKVYRDFINSLTDYEWWQWQCGATLEGINWYRWYKKVKNYSDFQMKSEFPTTADEAFQTKSGKYFTDEIITKLRLSCMPPKFIGEIRADAHKGENTTSNIHLVENSSLTSEAFKIWVFPDDGIEKTEKATNRFLVVVDVGGRSYKSDNSVISVFDRLGTMLPNGAIEKAAIWAGHCDPDILAWLAVRIATYYDNALLAIENNTIDSRYKKESEAYTNEGNHTFTVLDEIGEVYNNLYMREAPPDSANGRPTYKIGWNMNKSTKYIAYDSYSLQIRDNEYIERDHDTVDEAQWLQLKPNGTIEAMQGQRDDRQDTTAVGAYIARKQMPPVRIISKMVSGKATAKKGGVASI